MKRRNRYSHRLTTPPLSLHSFYAFDVKFMFRVQNFLVYVGDRKRTGYGMRHKTDRLWDETQNGQVMG